MLHHAPKSKRERPSTQPESEYKYGTEQHVDHFHHLFDPTRIQNTEYRKALKDIKPLVERNLIELTNEQLPGNAAFRVPEHDYLKSSMGRNNLHGETTYMSYVDDLFGIAPCTTQSEFSCFLPYLYPQWYAANRNASFIYIHSALDRTYYRRMPISSFEKLRFLRLNVPVHELKNSPFLFQGLIWNDFMNTPPEILEILRSITDVSALLRFINDIVQPDNLTPIDAAFIQALNEVCDRLNVSYRRYYEIATKISICGKFYDEAEFDTTNWCKKVLNILYRNGVKPKDITDPRLRAVVIAVAHVDIITPLSLQYMFLRFVHAATSPTHMDTSMKQQLKQLCSKDNISRSELTVVVDQLHPTESSESKQKRLVSLMQIWNEYNVLAEVETNKHNFGIINTELTQSLIQFFKKWYLKEVLTESGEPTIMLHALFNSMKIVDVARQSVNAQTQIENITLSYGNFFRHSESAPDFEFALCLNVLLSHLYPDLSVAGYYMGQIMCQHMLGIDDDRLNTMNAEFTLLQILHLTKRKYTVRTVTRIADGFETGTDSEGGRRRRKKTIKRKQQRTRGNKTKRN